LTTARKYTFYELNSLQKFVIFSEYPIFSAG